MGWRRRWLTAMRIAAKTGNVIWHEPAMEEKASFVVETNPVDPLKTRFNERQALESIAGVELAYPHDPSRASGIISFRVRGQDTGAVHQALKRARVVCAVRDEAIRLSPHFYQQGAPLQKLLEAVEDAIG